MNVTGRDIVLACAFLVVGWVLHMLWDAFLDWLENVTGTVAGMLWDICAIAGIVAVCVAVGWSAQHYWLSSG